MVLIGIMVWKALIGAVVFAKTNNQTPMFGVDQKLRKIPNKVQRPSKKE